MDSNKATQTGASNADSSKPSGFHHSAGSDALRKAYAKYNIHPTMSHATTQTTDENAKPTEAAEKKTI
ncbi:MAG: hypothetical protein STHCBS139747_003942 [Sporothrix thermara]